MKEKPLRQQWQELSVHDKYAVAMFAALFGIPGIALIIALAAVVLSLAGVL